MRRQKSNFFFHVIAAETQRFLLVALYIWGDHIDSAQQGAPSCSQWNKSAPARAVRRVLAAPVCASSGGLCSHSSSSSSSSSLNSTMSSIWPPRPTSFMGAESSPSMTTSPSESFFFF